MKRIQFRLEKSTHEALKKKAYAQRRSMASLVRDALDQYFENWSPSDTTLSDRTVVGSVRSDCENVDRAVINPSS